MDGKTDGYGVVRLRRSHWFLFFIRMPGRARAKSFLGHTFTFDPLVHGLKPVAIDGGHPGQVTTTPTRGPLRRS
jgi:hypothetical protein